MEHHLLNNNVSLLLGGDHMLGRALVPLWIGMLAFTGLFLAGLSGCCWDYDLDGFDVFSFLCPTGTDCDDENAQVNPEAPEVCDNAIDDDCDGLPDALDTDCPCVDSDGDGHGMFGNIHCDYPEPDCNDGNPYIYPGAPEICDAADNQCPGEPGAGQVDEGYAMACLPAGCFDMGDRSSAAPPNSVPRHEVCLSAFEMDFHEVTNAEYEECVDAGVCDEPVDPSSSTRSSYYGNPLYDEFPVIHVDRDMARQYCARLGNRLPTEAEWEYAARGGLAGYHYPSGTTISGDEANFLDSGDPWDNDTSEVGYYGANEYGLFDMAGNVWEWVEDRYDEGYYQDCYDGDFWYCTNPPREGSSTCFDPPGPSGGTLGVLRGGSWNDEPWRSLTVSYRLDMGADFEGESHGFRCARSRGCIDNDHDGYGDPASLDCLHPRWYEEDCDDANRDVYPGAPELCDGVDNQCPRDTGYGEVDETCGPMAAIPAGCFDMGDSNDGCYRFDQCPVHNVCVSAFEMDVHEVTNREYAQCVNAHVCLPPSRVDSLSRPTYYGNPAYDDFPVVFVTWQRAADYCAWLDKRLPAEAEWEYAARGGLAGKRYPWGDAISGSDANYAYSGDPWDNDTSPVEYHAPNGYGLYDIAGNVWEWVNDYYQSDYYTVSPTDDPPGPDSGDYGVLRGGSFSDWRTLELAVANRLHSTTTYSWFASGFRCARGGAYGP